jgi:pyruvate/2-oxoglutarate dehydrogenase complex dihydrolipoamide dehydrogenase (E3) component
VNPRIGRELEDRYTPPAKEHKTVLIAGGGIAGMQAAISCADRGHRVVLCEKSDALGGALRCEEEVPFKKKIRAYLDYQRREVGKRPIEVRLNTAVTPELVRSVAPDALLAALGARPSAPPIPGLDGRNVLMAEYAYRHVDEVGKKAVVLGGGLVGVELAIHLAGLGREVTVVEMLPALNNGGNILHQNALDVEIREKGVALSLGTRVLRVGREGVTGEKDGEERFFPADTVICAMGQQPLREEAEALRFCAPEFYVLGDCVAPKNILQATAMADAIAKNI